MSVGHSRLTSRKPSPQCSGRRREQLLQLALDALLLESRLRVELVLDVVEDLGDRDLQALLRATAPDGQRPQLDLPRGCSSTTVGGVIQLSGFTLDPPPSDHTMKVPSGLIISSRTASGSVVLSRPR